MPKQSFREAFLHYVWQYQYFDKENLTTTTGESITILSPGFLNKDSGPDFSNSRIIYNNIEWYGTTEVHYKTSDWTKHSHALDKAYNSVILHLVWEEDLKIERQDHSLIPTLELKNRVDNSVISLYQNLLTNMDLIPCQKSINKVDYFFISSMLEKTLIERLELKSQEIIAILDSTANNWEETCYQWIGKCFGFKINSDPLFQLCRLLPYSILKKYLDNKIQVDSLLFGVSGFLEKSEETTTYTRQLRKEYNYLKIKHKIEYEVALSQWKFLRLRPPNFPSLRIAQFSAFISSSITLTDIIFSFTMEEIKNSFKNSPNDFWKNHYHFNKTSEKLFDPAIGLDSIENIIINAIIPLRFAYAIKQDNEDLKASCLELFKSLKAEKNHITECYTRTGLKINSSYESQSFLHLYNYYCCNKECLNCIIGHQIIYPVAEKVY